MSLPNRAELFATIARPSGGLAMMALDGRESIRKILHDAGVPHEDVDLARTKQLIARSLGPQASAVLCDLGHGADAAAVVRDELPATGLVVAVDRFIEPRYGPLEDSEFDPDAVARATAFGAVTALKLYLYWRPDADRSGTLAQARAFVEACHDHGMLALLEGVVPVPAEDPALDDHLARAAEEFSAVSPDLYKTQAPTLGRGTVERIAASSARITEALGVPWVILSNGIPQARFAEVLEAVCDGGASGFLAGRGLWREAVEAASPAEALRGVATERFGILNDIVDRAARPWGGP